MVLLFWILVAILLLLTTRLVASGWSKVVPTTPVLAPQAAQLAAGTEGHRSSESEPSSTQNQGRIRSPAKEAGGNVKMGVLFSTSKKATSPHS